MKLGYQPVLVFFVAASISTAHAQDDMVRTVGTLEPVSNESLDCLALVHLHCRLCLISLRNRTTEPSVLEEWVTSLVCSQPRLAAKLHPVCSRRKLRHGSLPCSVSCWAIPVAMLVP